MKSDIFVAKRFNYIIIFLVALQIVVMMGITIAMVYSLVNDTLTLLSSISFVFLLLLSLPLSVLLFRSSKVNILKTIFFGIMADFALLSISGILWFIVPLTMDAPWMIFLAKLIMLLAYVPLIYALLIVYGVQKKSIRPHMSNFILITNVCAILLILYASATNFDSGNAMDIVVYTLSVTADIFILTMATTLLMTSLANQYKYIFSIIFLFIFISLIGDSLNLIDLLDLYTTSSYSQFFYDLMLIITSIAMLIYCLLNIKTISVEEVNRKLDDTRLQMNDIIKHSPDAMFICDSKGDLVTHNEQFLKIFNFSHEERSSGFNLFRHSYRLSTDMVPVLENLKRGETVFVDRIKLSSSNGEGDRYVAAKAFPTYGSDGAILSYVGMIEDITDRMMVEEELKKAYEEMETRVRERTAELDRMNRVLQTEIADHKVDEEKIIASLKEKEVLLKEVHHRVKNNLQIISSMLSLQASSIDDPDYVGMLKECQNRIRSIAIIHEKLYKSKDLASVDFAEYVNSLVNYLYHSYCPNTTRINLKMDVDSAYLNVDRAISCGLILNELISNAFKHAFPGNMAGEIRVSFHKADVEEYILNISDNGVGLPDVIDIRDTQSLGFQLVSILADSMDCKIEVQRTEGTGFRLTFKDA